MLRKLLLTLLLTVLPVLSFGSPARMERTEFCVAVGNVSMAAASMKNAGIDKTTFEQNVSALEAELKEFNELDRTEVLQAVRLAYAKGGPEPVRGQEAFDACMSKKTT